MKSHKVLSSAVIYIATNFLQKGSAFLLIPIYTSFLDAESYGIVGLVLSVSAILSIFYTLSMDAVATRFYFKKVKESDYYTRCFGTLNSMIIVLGFIATIIVVIIGPIIFTTFIPDLVVFPYLLLAIIISSSAPMFKVYVRLLRAKYLGKVFAIVSLSKFGIQAIFTIIFLSIFQLKEIGLLLATALTGIIYLILSSYVLIREYGIVWDYRYAKKIFLYSIPLVPNRFGALSVVPVQTFLIGFFHDISQVGFFHLGALIGSAVNVLAQSIYDAYLPWAYEHLEMSDKFNPKKMIKVTRSLIIFLSVVALILSLLSKEIFQLFVFGDLQQAWIVFPFFAFFAVVNFIKNIWLMPLMYKDEGTKYVQWSTYSNLIFNLMLGYILIPQYGILGAAISILSSRLLSSMVMMYFSLRLFDIGLKFKNVYLTPFLCFLVANVSIIPYFESFLSRLVLSLCILLGGAMIIRKEIMYFYKSYKSARV